MKLFFLKSRLSASRIPLLLFLIIATFSCKNQHLLKVDSTNMEGELDINSPLQITFSENVVPDSITGLWLDKSNYLDISPEVEGTYKWTTNNKLTFIPKYSLKPSTNYKVSLKKEILEYLDDFNLSGETYEFYTPLLKVIESSSYWDISSTTNKPSLNVILEFNYDMNPQDVLNNLSFSINKEEKELTAVTTETSNRLYFTVNDLEANDEDLKAQIILNSSLKAEGATEEMEKDYKENLRIPSPYKLSIIDVQTGHDGTTGTVTIRTTQAINSDKVKEFISLSPEVLYSVEVFPDYFLISSDDFLVEQQYEITIHEGLEGKIGGELKNDFNQELSFGEVEPTISFNDQSEFYVSGNGSRNIPVSIINIPEVQLKITKIYENNIIAFLRRYSNYNDYDYEYEYYYNDGPSAENFGDVVYQEEISSINLPSQGISKVLSLDFEDKFQDYPGIYVIEINDKENYWRKASKVVSISDIGIIAKKGTSQVSVFLNSIKDAVPLSDVEISFIGNNNQVTYTGKTGSDGVLTYNYDDFASPGFEPYLITAKSGKDYNVLAFNRSRVNTSRYDVGGMYKNESGLQAFIYGDRNLYRPGETMNISAIIRDFDWKTPGEIPVKLVITTPNGKILKSLRKSLNEYGSLESNIDLNSATPTGSYTVQVFTTNDVLIGSSVLKVEEFMPDRIKVVLNIADEDLKPGGIISTSIEATNLFGPPAADRNFEIEVTTNRTSFYPKDYSGYNFSINGINSSFSNFTRSGSTDSDGIANEEFDIPSEWENMGVLNTNVFSTVFDETGRPVNRLKSFKIYTQEVFLGIKSENYYNKTGHPVKLNIVALNKEGKALNDQKAQLELVQYEYKTVVSRNGRYFRYRSEEVENLLEKKTISINSSGSNYSFVPEISGRYEVRLYLPDSRTYISEYIYAYGWGSTNYGSFKVNKEGQIDIELDKDSYVVGDKAHVLLKTPFQGKVLVTVETDKVLDHFYVETDKRAASFDLDIKDENVPNVYITATLFKPHEKSDIPLTVAHGFKPLLVENPARKMDVKISAVEKSRSGTKQTINVSASPNSAVTLAVVDEGILQVGGYQTPNPYGWFYQKRALEVSSYNIYPYLFPEMGSVKSATGGGAMEAEMSKRLNPLQNNRVKLVSFWSGILNTDNRGNASFDIDIPEFSGNLRIMAVGYNQNEKFGYDKTNMIVADPIVQSVGLPRFLSPGDQFDIPVTLTNTTDKQASGKTILSISGPIEIIGEKQGSFKIEPGSEQQVIFKAKAKMSIGEAIVNVTSKALGETFISNTNIPIRPSSPLQKRSGSGTIKAGNSEEISINTEAFIEASADYKLIVSNNPLVEFSNSFDYLVRYPYGCVEQTVSAAFPQIYFSELLGSVYINNRAKTDAGMNVQKALDRIKLMQLYNGGLTYWPGSGYETWWGSVYAAHFALEAKKAGYDVDESFLDNLLKYLKIKLEEKQTITYYYNYGKNKKEIVPKEVAYSLYVLCQAGEKPNALLNYYKANSQLLSLDSKYLLAGAFALTGDTRKFKLVVPPAFDGEKSDRTFSGSFNSYIRDEALALNVLLDVDPDNNQIGILAKHVSKYLKNQTYLNTQERSFGFMAMGKVAKLAKESNIKGHVLANGKPIIDFENNTVTLNTKQLKEKKIEIETEGDGQLYYFWESEGISKDGTFLEEDNFIAVRKTLYNRTGQHVTNNTFKQNELVLVELSIKGLEDKRIENVAISDILPAGFEIENPRITSLPPGMSYPNSKSYPDYMDVRDDRINLFVDVSSSRKYYYYLVRCVSPGTFKMGPVGADAMYDGEYHSYSGGGEIIVTK